MPANNETARVTTDNRFRIGWLSSTTKFRIRKYLVTPLIWIVSCITYLLYPLLPNNWLRLDRPIFIIGCSRSGTTLFTDLLASSKTIAHWSEAPQVFEKNYCNPEVDHPKSSENISELDKRRIQVLFALYTKTLGKKRFLNKHPENSLRIEYLNKIFPDALFIHIIRDGREVVRSSVMETQRDPVRQRYPLGWFPKPPGWRQWTNLPLGLQFVYQWQTIIREIRASANKVLGANQYLEIRYDDLCSHPVPTIKSVAKFCGIEYEEQELQNLDKTYNAPNKNYLGEIGGSSWTNINAEIEDFLREQKHLNKTSENFASIPYK